MHKLTSTFQHIGCTLHTIDTHLVLDCSFQYITVFIWEDVQKTYPNSKQLNVETHELYRHTVALLKRSECLSCTSAEGLGIQIFALVRNNLP